MKHLKICSEVIAEVKDIMHYGSGSKLFSILYTGGESTIRKKMCRESIKEAAKESSADKSPIGKTERKIKYSMQYQAGNCDEMNDIAFDILKTKGLKVPLFNMASTIDDLAQLSLQTLQQTPWNL
ncbi:Putative type III effector with Hrp-box domain [Mycoavidus cysteinexigens]|uniref:Type III effector with Hrp-box domain n=1 Tax=Mycoavidus cysteinexigens TaxID=1553431 RepID=A0A2Z6EUF1_9BURK|nr:hypothetical protein [Mycoavidus cysteinexigens]BBE09077.1 Putative type III effector with Hrp-box domain [Mycoavidus cysteinexigens]GLR00258.1 hypothetical protein GCM10007934_00690 [Mycoavidus cysteinexigens]